MDKTPRLIVYSSLFPSAIRPGAGVFIRERMFRVGQTIPLVVVSPVPWFPLQSLIRVWRPHFRPQPAKYEEQSGVQVFYPRFFSLPGILKSLDGLFMAIACIPLLYKLKREFKFNLIDSHFAYPDGYAATVLGRFFKVPVTITLRGTELRVSKDPALKPKMMTALNNATRVFAVADALKQLVVSIGADADKIELVGNGVDTEKFFPLDKQAARDELAIPADAKVLVSVGGLVDRKGFHRVIEVLPELIKTYPNLIYLIIGGASPEGDNKEYLQGLVSQLTLQDHVRFLGALPSEQLNKPLSAADVFVLATANEGWANVFLEAMACGLPVITTDVGGNKEVVNDADLGTVVPFGEAQALTAALKDALQKNWDKNNIINYAKNNAWQKRVDKLVNEFNQLVSKTA
jgi:glycosyltransferase involved in cell wall biosynthesis